MADILDFTAIPAAKRSQAKANILAKMPNSEMTEDNPPVAKYTDTEWLNEIVWRFLIRVNRHGHDILVDQAAAAVIDIRNP